MTAREHARLKREILLAIGAEPGLMLFNNPVGFDADRRIKYGLGKGSFDLVGLYWGRFIALEVKTGEGGLTDEQDTWGDAVRECGGVAREVRSVEDARAALAEAKGDR